MGKDETKTSNSSGNKQNNQSMTLSASRQNELVTMGGFVEVRQGKTIKFYNGDKSWTQGSVPDFNIPN